MSAAQMLILRFGCSVDWINGDRCRRNRRSVPKFEARLTL